jgi:hypothetical protein
MVVIDFFDRANDSRGFRVRSETSSDRRWIIGDFLRSSDDESYWLPCGHTTVDHTTVMITCQSEDASRDGFKFYLLLFLDKPMFVTQYRYFDLVNRRESSIQFGGFCEIIK